VSLAQIDPTMRGADGRHLLPSFSSAERDRRYASVRARMAERELDALVVPAGDSADTQANARYLSQIGGSGAWVVLPATGEATVLLGSDREVRMWAEHLAWPSDLRVGVPSAAVPERLRDLGLARGRIGIVGLEGQFDRPEGIIPHETWRRITDALPEAAFVPAAGLMDAARRVKGEEEVAVIERVAMANEAAVSRMFDVARPGVEERIVWREMNDVLIRCTDEYPSRLSLGSNGRPAKAGNSLPLPISMDDGGVLSQEVAAHLQGYQAQSNHSIIVGARNPRYEEAMRAAIAVFEGLLSWVAPGRTLAEMATETRRLLAEVGGTFAGGPFIHTNGLGADRPRFGLGGSVRATGADPMGNEELVIEAGWTFTIKAGVTLGDMAAQVGSPVTVTAAGARRLGSRALVPYSTGGSTPAVGSGQAAALTPFRTTL
jgi:Xaa-Pro aminopeptidase